MRQIEPGTRLTDWTLTSVVAMVTSLQDGSHVVHIARHSTCSTCDQLDAPTITDREKKADLEICSLIVASYSFKLKHPD